MVSPTEIAREREEERRRQVVAPPTAGEAAEERRRAEEAAREPSKVEVGTRQPGVGVRQEEKAPSHVETTPLRTEPLKVVDTVKGLALELGFNRRDWGIVSPVYAQQNPLAVILRNGRYYRPLMSVSESERGRIAGETPEQTSLRILKQRAVDKRAREYIAELRNRHKGLLSSADSIEDQRMGILYPGGKKDVNLTAAYARLTAAQKTKLGKLQVQENNLRLEARLLNNTYLASTRRREAGLPRNMALFEALEKARGHVSFGSGGKISVDIQGARGAGISEATLKALGVRKIDISRALAFPTIIDKSGKRVFDLAAIYEDDKLKAAFKRQHPGTVAGIDKRITEWEKSHIKLADDQWITIASFNSLDNKYKQIAVKSGFAALNKAIGNDVRDYALAVSILKPFTDEEGTDISAFLRKNPMGRNIVLSGGFTPQQLKAAVEYNDQPFIKESSAEKWWAKVKAQGGQGLNVHEFMDFLKKHPSLAKEGRKILATVSSTRGKTPPESLDAFTSKMMSVRGMEPIGITGIPMSQQQLEAKELAVIQYGLTYGKGELAKSGAAGIASLFPPARALYPEVTMSDITAMEWGIGAAQVLLVAAPVITTPLRALGAVTAARLTGVGIRAGASMVFTAATVMNWNQMNPAERIIAVGIDALLIGSTAAGLRGLRGKPVPETLAKIVSKSKTKPPVRATGSAEYQYMKAKARQIFDDLISRGVYEQAKVQLSKAEVARLFKQAGLGEAAISDIMKPKFVRVLQRMTEAKARQIANSFRVGNQRFLSGRINQALRDLPRAKVAKIRVSKAEVSRLLRQAGLSDAAVAEFMKPKFIRILQRTAKARVRALIDNFKVGNERYIARRTSEVMKELPKAEEAKLTKVEVARLLKEAGMSEAAIKEFMKPKILRILQRTATANIKSVIANFKAGNKRFIEQRIGKVISELPVKETAKVSLSKAEVARLLRQAGLGEASIAEMLKPKYLRILQRASAAKIKDVLESFKRGNERFVAGRINQVVEAMPKAEPVRLSRAEVTRLFKEAGLSDAAVKDFMKPKYLRMLQRATEARIRQLINDYKVGNKRFVSGRVQQVMNELPKPEQPKISGAEARRLYKEAGLSEVTIADLMKPKSLRILQRLTIGQARSAISKIKQSTGNMIADMERAFLDAEREAGVSRKSIQNTFNDISRAIQTNNVLLLKAAAQRLMLIAARIPKLLGGRTLMERAKYLLRNPDKVIKLNKAKLAADEASKVADSVKVNKQFIEIVEKVFKTAKKRPSVEKAYQAAKKQVAVAEKFKEPLVEIKEVPAKSKVTTTTTREIVQVGKKPEPTAPPPKPVTPAPVRESAFPGITARKAVVTAHTLTGSPVEIPADAFSKMTAAQVAKHYGTTEEALVWAVAGSSTSTQAIVAEQIAKRTGEQTEPIPFPLTATQVQIQPAQKVKPSARAFEKPVAAEEPGPVPVPIEVPSEGEETIFKPLIPPLLKGATDKEKRERIKKSKGAIAWRQGELDGKDIFHVLMHPYLSKQDYVTVVGRRPQGAGVARGVGSAQRTIRRLYGRCPSKAVRLDMGFMDVIINPKGDGVTIDFKADPRELTTGDITIGRKGQGVTEKPVGLPRGRAGSITPKRPALKR